MMTHDTIHTQPWPTGQHRQPKKPRRWGRAHSIAAAVVGAALIAGGVAVAASHSDPIEAYLADVKAAAPQYGQEVPTDQQALVVGGMVCSMGDAPALDALPSQELLDVIRGHCGIFPLTEEQWARYGVPGAGSGGSGEPGSVELSQEAAANAAEGEAGAGVGAELSDRGTWKMAVGQPIQQTGQTVTITAIRPVTNADCTERSYSSSPALAPQNGRILAVDLTIVNGPDYDDTTRNTLNSAPSREFVGADGRAVDNIDADMQGGMCFGNDYLSPYGKARTYTGTIYVDVPKEAGFLLLGSAWDSSNQYEFELPASA